MDVERATTITPPARTCKRAKPAAPRAQSCLRPRPCMPHQPSISTMKPACCHCEPGACNAVCDTRARTSPSTCNHASRPHDAPFPNPACG